MEIFAERHRRCIFVSYCIEINGDFSLIIFMCVRYYSELLMDSQKLHIRQFAAESIGFLLRKVYSMIYSNYDMHYTPFRLGIMINYFILCLH